MSVEEADITPTLDNYYRDHAFYAGAVLLMSCTIPTLFIKKGAWLQHRVNTLGVWMIFVMSFPTFVDTFMFAVKSSHNVAPLWAVSILALVSNLALCIYPFYKIYKYKRNPFKEEVHVDLNAFKEVVAESQ